MGEEIVRSFVRKGNSGCSIRFFNVVGPNMDRAVQGYGRVIPNFVDSITQNKPLTIYGDGLQTRCFLWINDAVSALLKLIDFSNELPTVVNIGHSQQTSILDLARLFNEISGVPKEIEFLEKLPDEPRHRRPNISLAKSVLDWEPTIDLREIVSKILTEVLE
jgi:nucleoside-diphosphate-sugar epimerase